MVKEGDEITSGTVIAEIETDKATMEVESIEDGTLGKILVEAGGDPIPVNTPIALILAEGEDASALDAAPAAPQPAPQAEPQPEAPKAEPAPQPAPRAEAVTANVAVAALESNSPLHVTESAFSMDDPVTEPEPAFAKSSAMTVREALRDAMAEEMRRDKDVFLMGEEVAQYNGAYKVSQGLLDEFGAERVITSYSIHYTKLYDIHLTLLPYIPTAGELKTKPTQHSVKELRSIGLMPDVLVCRTDRPIPERERDKLALFCNVRITSYNVCYTKLLRISRRR